MIEIRLQGIGESTKRVKIAFIIARCFLCDAGYYLSHVLFVHQRKGLRKYAEVQGSKYKEFFFIY